MRGASSKKMHSPSFFYLQSGIGIGIIYPTTTQHKQKGAHMIKQGDRVKVRTDNFLGDIIEGGNPDYYGTVVSVYRSQYGEDVRIECDNGSIATVPSYRVEIQN